MTEVELSPFEFSFIIVFGEAENAELCKKYEFEDTAWMPEHRHADTGNYGSLSVVRMNNLAEFDSVKIVSICAHEATHVFQDLCETIGERTPSREFEAYHIGFITSKLFGAVNDQLTQT